MRAALIGALACLACEAAPRSGGLPVSAEPAADPAPELATRLAAYEAERRATAEALLAEPWSHVAGDDPYAVAAVDARTAVGVLRGADAVVLLDADGTERARLGDLDEPVAVAVDPSGWILALGGRGDVLRTRVEAGGLAPPQRFASGGTVIGRGLAAGPGGPWAGDADAGLVGALALEPGAAAVRWQAPGVPCRGPIALDVRDRLLAAVCLFDRSVVLAELAPGGAAVRRHAAVQHDGPWWSATSVADGDGWLVAGGGVEDHPLDRSDGSFGYVDPHVFVVRVRPCGEALCTERVAAINVGAWGVVMPKWVGLERHGDTVQLAISGYGGEVFASVDVGVDGRVGEPSLRTVPPGLRQLVRVGEGWLAANPLLDQWVRLDDDGSVHAVAPPGAAVARDVSVRVGEALFFTSLLAPGASSDGQRSRFTCETCHFEGTVDGRVHYTGRGDVHAATKPLLGLFRNRPHFSRALDRTLAVMVANEFDVANRGSAQGSSFSVSPVERPWLRELGVQGELGPEALRRAFMDFFEAFEHETAPRVHGRSAFTALEQRGAALFATHCEDCHQARTVTDDPATRVPPSQWAAHVFSRRGALVWASEARVRTGIEPYVHDEGARVTSLRRLWLKRPYFTNGSAAELDDVLRRVRLRPAFAHHAADAASEAGAGLDAAEREALRAFLALL